MKKYEFADGLMQFLMVIALLGGGLCLIGGLILTSEGGPMVPVGLYLAVAGAMGAISLLALAHVGRAILDIAENTGGMVQKGQVSVSAPPPLPSAPPPTNQGSERAFDARKWRFLKEVDSEVAGVADRLAAFGPHYEDEFAEKFLTLGDRSYLHRIEELLTARATEERRRQEEAMANIDQTIVRSSLQEMTAYRAVLDANSGFDPQEKRRVLDIEPYAGSWVGFQGGLKARLEDGSFLLVKKGIARRFLEDPDARDASPRPAWQVDIQPVRSA